jgi:hypothetical protein
MKFLNKIDGADKLIQDSNNRLVTDAEKTAWNGKQNALGYTPVNKAGDIMTGTLVVDGKNLPSGADIVTMKRGSGTNRFVLETQDKAMQVFMEAGGAYGLTGTITASDFRIRTKYTDRVSIRGSDGNVGIGTTSPTQTLDVNGKIRMRTQTAAADGDDIIATKKYVDDGLDGKVDNSRVLTDVPVNAKFTDTTYSEITTSEIDAGTSSTLRTISGRRIKYILDKVQGWINALTKADVGLNNVDNVKQATKVEFDEHLAETATQAHFAKNIAIEDSGARFTSGDVEGALNELFTSVSDGKTVIASSITDMGQAASGSDTFAQLAAKIRDISKDATASVGDVLAGKTFYQGGVKRTGTMANQGAKIITPSTTNQAIAAGYHNGSGYVVGDANLIAENILSGKSIFGVVGNVVPGKKYATGTGTTSALPKNFSVLGYMISAVYTSISGLDFTPSVIIVRGPSVGFDSVVFKTRLLDSSAYYIYGFYSNNGERLADNIIGMGEPYELPCGNLYQASKSYTWYAWE